MLCYSYWKGDVDERGEGRDGKERKGWDGIGCGYRLDGLCGEIGWSSLIGFVRV
jgi:hypothetical protein